MRHLSLAASDRDDDFEAVAVFDENLPVTTPGNDLAVSLDRDLLARQRHLLDQRADREGLLEALGGAVDRYLNHRAILPLALALASGSALGAGAAYQVDTAEVSAPGSCKVEAWFSSSSERDAIAAMNPACVVDLSRPVELGVQVARGRSEGEYSSTATPKAKTNLLPGAIGRLGVAVAAGAAYDFSARDTTAVFATLPTTLRLSDNARINLSVGWLRDRALRSDFGTYGAGVDLRTADNVWTLTGEMFGQAAAPAPPGANQPRYQLGVRYRPVDPFNVDLIYGRNLSGEGGNWLTVSSIFRFR